MIKELECNFCSRNFDTKNRKPRLIFQCGHTICNYCLNRYLDSTQESFICPLDENPILMKNKNIESFPINFYVLRKVQNLLKENKKR